MTAQIPEILTNECPDIDFENLQLFSVIHGHIQDAQRVKYNFSNKGDPEKGMATHCWRGYVSIYKITPTGRLILTGFSYPFSNEETTEVLEEATGDFYLDMREEFFEPSTLIPFQDGKLITNKAEWQFPSKTQEISNSNTIKSYLNDAIEILQKSNPYINENLNKIKNEIATHDFPIAIKSLSDLGDTVECRGGFWRNLQRAARVLNLKQEEYIFNEKFHNTLKSKHT